jgi:translocation protein SEC66
MAQAHALAPNWGQTIFQSANEIAANTQLRERLDAIQAQVEHEKAWWEKRRASIKNEFMKELESEAQAKGASEDEPVLVDTNTPSATPSGGSKKKKNRK